MCYSYSVQTFYYASNILYFLEWFVRGLLISPFALCAVNSRARYIRVCGRIVRARSINFTVCVMRGLFEGAVYSEGANYSRKYGT